jgi:hypothetical protein
MAQFRPPAVLAPQSAADIEASKNLLSFGIAMLGELLTKSQCVELQRYFQLCSVFDPYGNADQKFLPRSAERCFDTHIAHHVAEDILRAPHLLALANHPRIVAIAGQFLGCKPTIGYLAAWWSYHTGKGAQQAELFHRDVDDWKFVKLFVYLMDVNESGGPHVYVRQSARSAELAKIGRFADDEVRQAFGDDNIVTLNASAGQGFLEDTFGIHRGQPVASGRRLIFQVVYSMFPLPYGPRRPVVTQKEIFEAQSITVDPWINRLYVRA